MTTKDKENMKEICPVCGAEMEEGKCAECESDGCGVKKKKGDAAIAPVNRFDAIDLPYYLTKTFTRTSEGFLKGRAIVTNVGVFTYMDGKGLSHTELRLPEEVFAPESVDTLKLKPITNDHPKEIVTVDNIKKYQVGNLGDNPGSEVQAAYANYENDKRTDGYHLAVDMIITDGQAIDDILNGKQSLSCGYSCELEVAPPDSVWCGVKYDYIQRKIRYNHVAIVDTARAGDAAKIRMDSADAVLINIIKEDTMELKKITLDSVEYQAEAPVLVALSKANEKADAAGESIIKLTQEKSVVEAERDTLAEKVDGLSKELEAVKAEKMDQAVIDAAVNQKLSLMHSAEKAGVEVKADMAEVEIKKAVIMKVFPAAKLDGKDDAYIQARFDAAVEDMEISSENDAEARKVTVDGVVPGKGKESEVINADAARENMIARMTGTADAGK